MDLLDAVAIMYADLVEAGAWTIDMVPVAYRKVTTKELKKRETEKKGAR